MKTEDNASTGHEVGGNRANDLMSEDNTETDTDVNDPTAHPNYASDPSQSRISSPAYRRRTFGRGRGYRRLFGSRGVIHYHRRGSYGNRSNPRGGIISSPFRNLPSVSSTSPSSRVPALIASSNVNTTSSSNTGSTRTQSPAFNPSSTASSSRTGNISNRDSSPSAAPPTHTYLSSFRGVPSSSRRYRLRGTSSAHPGRQMFGGSHPIIQMNVNPGDNNRNRGGSPHSQGNNNGNDANSNHSGRNDSNGDDDDDDDDDVLDIE